MDIFAKDSKSQQTQEAANISSSNKTSDSAPRGGNHLSTKKLISNRKSALRTREKKAQQMCLLETNVEDLSKELGELLPQLFDLRQRYAALQAQNSTLKSKLQSSDNVCSRPNTMHVITSKQESEKSPEVSSEENKASMSTSFELYPTKPNAIPPLVPCPVSATSTVDEEKSSGALDPSVESSSYSTYACDLVYKSAPPYLFYNSVPRVSGGGSQSEHTIKSGQCQVDRRICAKSVLEIRSNAANAENMHWIGCGTLASKGESRMGQHLSAFLPYAVNLLADAQLCYDSLGGQYII